MWHGEGALYFACTSGGRAGCGQVWRYRPGPAEGTPEEDAEPGVLELFVQPDDASVLDHVDNLVVAPWGDLILCEDGSGEQFMVGVRPDGSTWRVARNAASGSELAGACFSPDGSTLFVNLQHDGLTLAITGPWPERAAPRA
jgi:secreted PhoX family phosphatase